MEVFGIILVLIGIIVFIFNKSRIHLNEKHIENETVKTQTEININTVDLIDSETKVTAMNKPNVKQIFTDNHELDLINQSIQRTRRHGNENIIVEIEEKELLQRLKSLKHQDIIIDTRTKQLEYEFENLYSSMEAEALYRKRLQEIELFNLKAPYKIKLMKAYGKNLINIATANAFNTNSEAIKQRMKILTDFLAIVDFNKCPIDVQTFIISQLNNPFKPMDADMEAQLNKIELKVRKQKAKQEREKTESAKMDNSKKKSNMKSDDDYSKKAYDEL